MRNTNRREFLKSSTTLGASAIIIPTIVPLTFFGCESPNNQINVGLIGCRNQGFYILKRHLAIQGVRCIALCDTDENILNERAATIEKEYQQKPLKYRDFRKMLENKEIDVVIIGTPDHWHCLQMVFACQAGKDVYVEKPMAKTIGECNIMVKAAQKYGRIVQIGQQQRSGTMWASVINHIKSGEIGKLRKVSIWGNFTYGVGGPLVPDSPVPKGIDYDMWLGPAPKRPFNESRYHRYWRMFWDYGGGIMTDWGVHLIDMALWAKDINHAPKEVMSYGKNLSFPQNAHETYDTMSVVYPMDDFIITWDQTCGIDKGPWGKGYGLAFVGDKGTIVVNREGGEIIPEVAVTSKSVKTEKLTFGPGSDDHGLHVKNFIECVKSRKIPICPPEKGRVVATFAHMSNIAARTGEGKLVWDDKKNEFINSPKANELLVPDYRGPWELPKI